MSDKVIGVGVIGCGEIAQLMHLPFIEELPAFRVAALCDISAGVLEKLGTQYAVTALYSDYRALLADPNVEAVVICTYDHGEIVTAALAAGKHVLVEKPLAFTPEEAQPLVEQAEASGLVALVGYMKLYDPGYETGLKKIAAIGKPRSIHIHDFAGRFDRYGALYTQHRASDVPADVMATARAAAASRIDAALGPDHAAYRDHYLLLLMLGSHDLAVLRGAFGTDAQVAYARTVGSDQILALLEFPGGVPCYLDIGVAKYEWWDEFLHVHGDTDEVRITFQNPYWKHASAFVTVKEAVGEAPVETVLPGLPDTAFRREWLHFADCILNGATPRTPLSGGLADLDLAVAIIKALPAK
ncbi:gfo/Idh/MocA family oxidoreductase [Kaistia algarum]|uniref:Gfo/Idh/MocA family protein n=1 Tax=Kaistia algarum TaxID=2083279 RepID=UPI000CE75FB4|nr:Gfo/Idh/MocA family oxidoreductase [Kaistia algarum]MCX5513128.1 Gfo/Idh/MocA family oxidoreductase [Kaistia algarum]PPE81401.1 gfo/Idh/MocA family oxidoreductase [Kaistia algarum]